jgi:hypothetical protein
VVSEFLVCRVAVGRWSMAVGFVLALGCGLWAFLALWLMAFRSLGLLVFWSLGLFGPCAFRPLGRRARAPGSRRMLNQPR